MEEMMEDMDGRGIFAVTSCAHSSVIEEVLFEYMCGYAHVQAVLSIQYMYVAIVCVENGT